MAHATDYLSTPLGLLKITASQKGVRSVVFVEQASVSAPSKLTDAVADQLTNYFEGSLTQFDLPLEPEGTTFQQQVWQQLENIGYGKVCSYRDIAIAINNPKSVRAVGAANGKNPISIIVPCHRVIGANGTLTGYAGGLDRKAWLLRHEGIMLF